jgi:hypothetical protein
VSWLRRQADNNPVIWNDAMLSRLRQIAGRLVEHTALLRQVREWVGRTPLNPDQAYDTRALLDRAYDTRALIDRIDAALGRWSKKP